METRSGGDPTVQLPGGGGEAADQHPRITAVSLPFPGVRRVLQEGEKLGLWRYVEATPRGSLVPDSGTILLGAWHPFYAELLDARPQCRFGVLWTSSVGEVDMAGSETGRRGVEVDYLVRILGDPRISFIWFGDPSLAELFPQKGFCAPYPLALPSTVPPMVAHQPPGYMTLMCPDTLKKNTLNQLLAAALLYAQVGIRLTTNAPVPLALLSHRGPLGVDLSPWLPEDRYRALLAGARLNLCCSWAETFSYQAAEAALAGVPSVGTRTIPWLPQWAICDEPNSPVAIAGTAMQVLDMPHAGDEMRRDVIKYAQKANSLLRAILTHAI